MPSAQNDAIENYITQKVDGIILVAIDVNGVKPAITAAKAAGIPVIAIDAQIPDGDNVAFVGVDNTKAGEDIGKFYADYVKTEMGGTAKIGVVGALNSFIQNQRLDGFKKAVTDSGLDVTFLDTVDGQNVQETALSASENLMTANPDMTTLYATGEPALIGAVSAVTSQGRTGDVKVFGWDLTKQADRGHRRRLGDGCRAAGSGRRRQGGRRSADQAQEGRKGRADHQHPGDDRDQGQCRAVPRRCSSKRVHDGRGRDAAPDAAERLCNPRIHDEPDGETYRVRMTGISKRYNAIQTLDDVSLTLKPGEVLGLVGDNGAGKSTLSKVLSGAVIPDAGTIEIDGKAVSSSRRRPTRVPRASRWSIRTFRSATRSMSRAICSSAASRAAASPGMSFLDKKRMHDEARAHARPPRHRHRRYRLKVENLSGGQRQSIAIGRAASFEPSVLIMDEPTAALAVAEVEAVLDLIRTVSARGVSVILITHRLQDLFLVCDRIQVMYEGRNVAERRSATPASKTSST